MKDRPPKRTKAELRLAASGIAYRVDQMTGAVETLDFAARLPNSLDYFGPVNPQVVHNALIESVLVNARVLAYFVAKNRQAAEVTALDFLDVDEWDRAVARREIGRVIGLVSDHLAHAKHIAPPEPWELVTIASQIVTHLARFRSKLVERSPDRADWFEPALAEAIAKLDLDPT